jgi:hypothetical protein
VPKRLSEAEGAHNCQHENIFRITPSILAAPCRHKPMGRHPRARPVRIDDDHYIAVCLG